MIETPEPYIEEDASERQSGVHLAVRLHRARSKARHHWWIIAVTIMIGLGIQDALCLLQNSRYVSVSRMMVNGRIMLPQGGLYSGGPELAEFYGTQVALMKSPQMANRAMDLLTTTHPDVAVDPDVEVEATMAPKTAIFELKVTSKNPDFASLFLDSIMDTYLSSQRGWKNQTTDVAVSAITEEVSRLDAEIGKGEQQLMDFEKENNVVFIEDQSSSTATYLVGLNKELARLTKERDLLDLVSKDPSAANAGVDDMTASAAQSSTSEATGEPASVTNAPQEPNAIFAEQDRIEKLKILRSQYAINFKPAHPKMKELDDSIAQEEKFLELLKSRNQQARDAHRDGLDLQIKNLQHQTEVWNAKALELSQRLGTYQQLKSKITREQALYNQLAANIPNVTLNKSLDEDVVILEAAATSKLIPHHNLLRLALAAFGGLVFGLVVIYGLSRLDDKVDSPYELQENIEFPLLGQVPLARVNRKTKRVPLLEEEDERHDFLENHREIRSAILFGQTDLPRPRSLMITSAAPGDGKSTLAANLATVFARCGNRVLLIDADLRRGVLHDILDVPGSPGLSECLHSKVAWQDVIQNTSIPNLDLLPRGKASRQAGELLLSPITELLLHESTSQYDLVLWDTAPLFAVHDATNLCSSVDGVLFVARARSSTLHGIESALENLERRDAHIYGIVLNAVLPGQPGYKNKYRYKAYGPEAVEV